jgi:hypothetical protein
VKVNGIEVTKSGYYKAAVFINQDIV